MLVLLYCLSQNPNFSESLKPLMEKLKDSEQMLCFLKDLSRFTETFSSFQSQKSQNAAKKPQPNEGKNASKENKEHKEKPQSPTDGIADDFIQNILETYLKQH